jgi:hypothetical protein
MWANFFVAAAGASAALAGLLFVALSVNISRILQYPQLPSRAGAAIAALLLILITSMVALIQQSARSLGIEVLMFGAAAWFIETWAARRSFLADRKSRRPRHEVIFETLMGQIQALPFCAGGIMLIGSHAAGMYWIATGVIAIFILSIVNAWVLLVEILR